MHGMHLYLFATTFWHPARVDSLAELSRRWRELSDVPKNVEFQPPELDDAWVRGAVIVPKPGDVRLLSTSLKFV